MFDKTHKHQYKADCKVEYSVLQLHLITSNKYAGAGDWSLAIRTYYVFLSNPFKPMDLYNPVESVCYLLMFGKNVV